MSQLLEIIKSRIRTSGPITFSEFMELALYEDGLGYYNTLRTKIGSEGDYYTSPNLGRGFGEALANFIDKSFQLTNAQKFTVIEPGAGKGLLALDILSALRGRYPECYEAVTYILADRSAASFTRSESVLESHGDKIRCYGSLDEIRERAVTGLILSNEFFDALPFHRLIFKDGGIYEIYVTIENDRLAETLAEPSTKELTDYITASECGFIDGQQIEINLEAGKALGKMSGFLGRGFVLTIDYGYLTNELYNENRAGGTYKCIHGHKINTDPFINVGDQDITAHVDFGNLIRAGREARLTEIKYTTQGQFLIDWGILDIMNTEADEIKRSAMKNLFLPESMGNKFKVLIQSKNIDTADDFYPESPFNISFRVL